MRTPGAQVETKQVSQIPRTSDPQIIVSWTGPDGERRERLARTFCIGQDSSGQLSVDDREITRAHAAVFLRDGQWWVRDLGGRQDTLLDGVPIQSAPLPRRGVLGLAQLGRQVVVEVEDTEGPARGVVPELTGISGQRTVLHSARRPAKSAPDDAPPIRVALPGAHAAREFTGTIRIGRDVGCTLRITDDAVSRLHAEVFRIGRQWFARDLGSSNGTYLDGTRIQDAPLPGSCSLRLGEDGPTLELSYDAPAATQSAGSAAPRSIEEVAAHYFDPNAKTPAGDRTMWVRQAFSTVQRKQKRRYGSIIAGAVGLLLIAVAVGIYQYVQLQRTRGLAEQMFYNMKTVELQLARLEQQVAASGDATHGGELAQGREKLAEMATQYDSLLEELGILNDKTAPEDRLIFRMARTFGECEIAMPKDFVDEVKRYIELWRNDERLVKGLQRASEQGLAPVIVQALERHGMPPQFFYVALQESDFLQRAVGPETRFGIAKGLWQLMPETAIHYGLKMGPLLERPIIPSHLPPTGHRSE